MKFVIEKKQGVSRRMLAESWCLNCLLHIFMTNDKIIFCLYCAFLGRLRDPARMYGEVFVNGVKSEMPYGSYVSALLFHLHSFPEAQTTFQL